MEIQDGATSCVCEFCGTRQTLPSNQDENLQGLFNRANVLRIKSEFDKAADIYEKILQADQTEAEAYWGLILCKYGIEYVEDPATYKRIPTCHRASYDAVTTDEDYKNALRYADAVQREIYETEAAKIEEIQKGILAIAQKESPYDVFICYKETDDSGNRTQDSVIANDIYYQLTHEGFKVFYAAISLEDKLGSEYEPVIFSALNTAKVMLALGTKPEYFNAVWVKNEWSRFLKIMKKDRTRLMIPCYKDMDPYELPEEFAHLQAQNMGKIGFINDLVRGIKKVIGKDQPHPAAAPIPVAAAAPVYTSNVNALIKRGNMALEDGEWEKANGFFEDALNQDAECAEAYIGKFLVSNKQSSLENMGILLTLNYHYAFPEKLQACPANEDHIIYVVNNFTIPGYLGEEKIRKIYDFDRTYTSILSYRIQQKDALIKSFNSDRFLSRAVQYAKGASRDNITTWINSIIYEMDKRIQQARLLDLLERAMVQGSYARFITEANQKVQKMWQDAAAKRENDYQSLLNKSMNANKISHYEFILNELSSPGMANYKNSSELQKKCQSEIRKLKEEEEIEQKKIAQKNKKNIAMITIVAITVLVIAILMGKIIIPQHHYNSAVQLMGENNYYEAFKHFANCKGYKNSNDIVQSYFNDMNFTSAISWVDTSNFDKETSEYLKSCIENKQIKESKAGDIVVFGHLADLKLEWVVLDNNGTEILLLCRSIVATKEYDENNRPDKYKSFSWRNSTIRAWLNKDFKTGSFTNNEAELLNGEIRLMTIEEVGKYRGVAKSKMKGNFMLMDVLDKKYDDSNLGGAYQIQNWEIVSGKYDWEGKLGIYHEGKICPVISIRQ